MGYVLRYAGNILGSSMGTVLYNKKQWGWGLDISQVGAHTSTGPVRGCSCLSSAYLSGKASTMTLPPVSCVQVFWLNAVLPAGLALAFAYQLEDPAHYRWGRSTTPLLKHSLPHHSH